MTVTLAPAPRSRTTEALAQRLCLRVEEVEQILEESERMGIVVRVRGGWRLSAKAEHTIGWALRGMGDR
jgi:hypothetical protein